jgi:AcrR family transcriptional regulator
MATRPKRKPAIGRPRARHLGPKRRRPQVLDVALRLFIDKGYESTSMDEIAGAAGVTKPVVYDCYAGKEELFNALLRREEERVLSQIAAALPAGVDLDDPERTLIEGFTAFFKAVAAAPDSYRVILLGGGGANSAVQRRVRRGRQQQVEAVAGLASRWLEAEGADDAAALLVGEAVVSLAEAGARTLLVDDSWTPESLGQALGGLAARGQGAMSAPSHLQA